MGASGQPAFGSGLQSASMWQDADSSQNSAGFYKDSTGTVHLKGLVKFKTNTGNMGTVRLTRNTDNAGFTRPRKATAPRSGGCS